MAVGVQLARYSYRAQPVSRSGAAETLVRVRIIQLTGISFFEARSICVSQFVKQISNFGKITTHTVKYVLLH